MERPALQSILNSIVKIVGYLGLFFILYLAYFWWDVKQLRSFCDDTKVGTPVTVLPQIAEHHNIDSKWIKGDGAFNEKQSYWSYYIPSTASVGDIVCTIRHDKNKIISAEMDN